MITKEMKAGTDRKIWRRSEGDTGSPEVQVAILTARINDLQDHFKANPKGSSFQKRSSENGRSEKKPSRIPESKRY